VNDSCFIGNIFGSTSANGIPVLVNMNGRLGTTPSSARFKDEIKPIGKASQALFALTPVSFRYKKQIDAAGTPQFGLLAEDVERISPDLVVHDEKGKPYSVRYDQVNAMLLNEFLKEHKMVEELKATLGKQVASIAQQQSNFQSQFAQQQKRIEALTSGLHKVKAKIETGCQISDVSAVTSLIAVIAFWTVSNELPACFIVA
jgi:hypothetical protein